MRIAVLGGGNGSFAAAGDMALAGHDVRLWRRDRAAVEAHRSAGSTIVVKDFRGRHDAKLALVTNAIAEAVRDAELILCPVPATAHHDIARALAPHLADGQVVFLPPGTFGSYIFAHSARAGEEWMYGRGSHDRLTDSGDWREHIVLTQHRYMLEDVRIGLSFLVSVGELAGVPTPLARAFLSIGGAICDEDFMRTGRTLASLGLPSDRNAVQRILAESLP